MKLSEVLTECKSNRFMNTRGSIFRKSQLIRLSELMSDNANNSYFISVDEDDVQYIMRSKNETENEIEYKYIPEQYPLHLVKDVRYALGYDEHDDSHDEEIYSMKPFQFFTHVCQYDGLSGSYSSTIANWILQIYGIDIKRK